MGLLRGLNAGRYAKVYSRPLGNYAKGISKSKNLRNKIGADFENLLVNKLGGTGGFKAGGRQFDGAFGNVWYEAKGGDF